MKSLLSFSLSLEHHLSFSKPRSETWTVCFMSCKTRGTSPDVFSDVEFDPPTPFHPEDLNYCLTSRCSLGKKYFFERRASDEFPPPLLEGDFLKRCDDLAPTL